MCVSARVETEVDQLASRLGLLSLQAFTSTPHGPERPSSGDGEAATDRREDPPLCARLEARADAWVVRRIAGGRIVAERMTFNPYVVRRTSLAGDMWARNLAQIGNHGLVVLRGFSEWVAPELLLEHRVVALHDVHCAFNRVLGRMLLANFTADGSILVPVLFDQFRDVKAAGAPGTEGASMSERAFVMISDEPSAAMQSIGVAHCPLSLDLEDALAWVHGEDEAVGDVLAAENTGSAAAPLSAATTTCTAPNPAATSDASGSAVELATTDFEEVLGQAKSEFYSFSLFKSA